MYDGANFEYEKNVAVTARVAAYAHARGVFVEAELGKVGGKDGAHAPGYSPIPVKLPPLSPLPVLTHSPSPWVPPTR